MGHRREFGLAGDTLSRLELDRVTASLFGDAGSATMVEQRVGSGVSWFRLGSDGRGSDSLIVPAGGARLIFQKKRLWNIRTMMAIFEPKKTCLWMAPRFLIFHRGRTSRD